MGNKRFDTTFSFSIAKANARVVCLGCGRERVIGGAVFFRLMDPMPLKEAEKRLRCAACNHKGAKVYPVPVIHDR